jgi:hypothetical protein
MGTSTTSSTEVQVELDGIVNGELNGDHRAMRPACGSADPHTDALEIHINERVTGAVYMAKGKWWLEKEAVGWRVLAKEEGRRRDMHREVSRQHDRVRRRLRYRRENKTKEGEKEMKKLKNTCD